MHAPAFVLASGLTEIRPGLIFWTLVIGPLGGLLDVPLTLFVKAILVDANPSMRWLGAWLGDADPPSA